MRTIVLVGLLTLGVALCVRAEQPAALPTDLQLKLCQEQLADVRGAVAKIHQPNAAFQAESLVTLDRKLTEAQQQQARDVATIAALRKELEAIRKPGAEPAGQDPPVPAPTPRD